MFAIIQSGSKQYRVEEGKTVEVDLLPEQVGGEIVFNEVLLVENNGQIKIGQPFIATAKVTGSYVKIEKDKKLTVFHFKRRKGVRTKTGHRQKNSAIKLNSIQLG